MIGIEGNSGCSTGSHLHFDVYYGGERINPGDLFGWALSYGDNCELVGGDTPLIPGIAYGNENIHVVVNGRRMPLENYVLGVILAEMGTYGFPAEAIKANAVAARGYAFRRGNVTVEGGAVIVDMGQSSSRSQNFDLDTFNGLSNSHQALIIDAINSTQGEVLMHNGRIVESEYTACSSTRNVYVLPNTEGRRVDSHCSPEIYQEYLDYKSEVDSSIFMRNFFSGKTVCPSSNTEYCGHNRGMSQFGAMYLAGIEGATYDEILDYYYNATIEQVTVSYFE